MLTKMLMINEYKVSLNINFRLIIDAKSKTMQIIEDYHIESNLSLEMNANSNRHTALY